MFKGMLKILGGKICSGKMPQILTMSILLFVAVLTMKYPIIGEMVDYAFYSAIGAALFILFIMVILCIHIFINWLFIVPYKHNRQMKS